MYFVYMLRCADGSLYTGSTDDPGKRFEAHAAGKGARYTRSHPPVGIAAVWRTETKGDALKLEYRIKHLSKEKKERLVRGESFDGFSEENRSCLSFVREKLWL